MHRAVGDSAVQGHPQAQPHTSYTPSVRSRSGPNNLRVQRALERYRPRPRLTSPHLRSLSQVSEYRSPQVIHKNHNACHAYHTICCMLALVSVLALCCCDAAPALPCAEGQHPPSLLGPRFPPAPPPVCRINTPPLEQLAQSKIQVTKRRPHGVVAAILGDPLERAGWPVRLRPCMPASDLACQLVDQLLQGLLRIREGREWHVHLEALLEAVAQLHEVERV